MGPETVDRTATRRWWRVSKLEIAAAALGLVTLVILVVLEPDVLEAPFASSRAAIAFFGGTLAALAVLALMLRFGVPPILRVVVLGVPLVAVSWWLVKPYFVDVVVNDDFASSIAEQQPTSTVTAGGPGSTTLATNAPSTSGSGSTATSTLPTVTSAQTSPRLLASGTFIGLAGHDGQGDAGIFRLPDGNLVLRLENFDIDNGPDLELYLVPGKDTYSPKKGSLHFGALRGNKGDQTYSIPDDFAVSKGPWTVLVWCEAFRVEFVGATVSVA